MNDFSNVLGIFTSKEYNSQYIEDYNSHLEQDQARAQVNNQVLQRITQNLISGFENCAPENNPRDLSRYDVQSLHHLATAHCIELSAFKQFKEFYSQLDQLTQARNNLEARNHTKGILNLSLNTTEKIAFYFYVFGHRYEGEICESLSSRQVTACQKALESDSPDIKAFADLILSRSEARELNLKIQKCVARALDFSKELNKDLYMNEKLRNEMKHMGPFINLLNITNNHFKDFGDQECSNEKITLLKLDSTQWDLINHGLDELENVIKQQRLSAFGVVCQNLKKIRSNQKDKIKFTQQFLQHNKSFITIEIEDYPRDEIFQTPLPNKVSAKPRLKAGAKKRKIPKGEKEYIAPKPTAPKPKPVKSKPPLDKKIDLTPKTIPERIEFVYADRVLDWFRDKPEQLKQKSYASLSEKGKFKQHVYHGFIEDIDSYVSTYASKTSYLNTKQQREEVLYGIPGQIRFKDGKIERGVFTYCIGEECYHRHFSKRKTQNFEKLAEDTFHNFDFPSLMQSEEMDFKKASPISLKPVDKERATITQDPFTKAITITDHFFEVEYTLFKTGM